MRHVLAGCLRVVALPVIVVMTGSRVVRAQAATMQATATVSTPMAVTGLGPLTFGTVYPGVPKTVAYNQTTSGRFRIIGNNGATISITLAFPAVLRTATLVPLTVGAWDVRQNNNNSAGGATVLPVVNGVPLVHVLHPSGRMHLFIGGRVTPTATQAAGSYTGTITLTAAYTGT